VLPCEILFVSVRIIVDDTVGGAVGGTVGGTVEGAFTGTVDEAYCLPIYGLWAYLNR
jgi:hypothetical protein